MTKGVWVVKGDGSLGFRFRVQVSGFSVFKFFLYFSGFKLF